MNVSCAQIRVLKHHSPLNGGGGVCSWRKQIAGLGQKLKMSLEPLIRPESQGVLRVPSYV